MSVKNQDGSRISTLDSDPHSHRADVNTITVPRYSLAGMPGQLQIVLYIEEIDIITAQHLHLT